MFVRLLSQVKCSRPFLSRFVCRKPHISSTSKFQTVSELTPLPSLLFSFPHEYVLRRNRPVNPRYFPESVPPRVSPLPVSPLDPWLQTSLLPQPLSVRGFGFDTAPTPFLFTYLIVWCVRSSGTTRCRRPPFARTSSPPWSMFWQSFYLWGVVLSLITTLL